MSDQRLMTCEQLDERLPNWLENDLDPTTRALVEQHVAVCARCTALVSDLAFIRRQAAALPELVPSRDLWPEIEARIQAPVIPLETQRAAQPGAGRGRSRHAWWLGAAAAALVAVTAGVTHYMTKLGQPAPTVAVAPAVVRTLDSARPVEVTEPAASLASTEAPRTTPQPDERPVASAPAPVNEVEQSEYARDVAQLRAIVRERRTELDSTTVAVLEKNLELIDRAIAESRAALERDPASDFLADQLARAMTKKVAILRTVALLPARS